MSFLKFAADYYIITNDAVFRNKRVFQNRRLFTQPAVIPNFNSLNLVYHFSSPKIYNRVRVCIPQRNVIGYHTIFANFTKNARIKRDISHALDTAAPPILKTESLILPKLG